MGREMKPFKAWVVTAANHQTGVFLTRSDARDDARDLREHWRKKPTITPAIVTPIKPRRGK